MTRRGQLVLALGVLAYGAAWLFGAASIYPAAAGLVLAPLGARLWVRAAAGPIRLARRSGRGAVLEGEDVWVRLEAEPRSRVPAPSLRVRDRLARLGDRDVLLRRHGRAHRGTYVLESVPRGRYAVEESVATIEDPFGLARSDVPLDTGGAVLVYPRLVELGELFSETGAHAQDGRRLLLRRPSGFDLHSVREYERGESLRKVHWATRARSSARASTCSCALRGRCCGRTRRAAGAQRSRSTRRLQQPSASRRWRATGRRRSAFSRRPSRMRTALTSEELHHRAVPRRGRSSSWSSRPA